MKNYSVSICTFGVNETDSLAVCVDTILSKCNRGDIEEIIICTCERTTDLCLETIEKLKRKYPDTKIIDIKQPPESKYWGGACRTMFDAATGSHILSMSSDLECNPDYVPNLITASKASPDSLIKASRWLNSSEFNGYGNLRKAGNKAFQLFMRVLFKSSITDYTYSFQIAPADVFKKTYFHKNGRTVAVELIAEPLMKNIQIKEIPINWKKRPGKKSGRSFFKDINHLFWYIIAVFDIRFNINRRFGE